MGRRTDDAKPEKRPGEAPDRTPGGTFAKGKSGNPGGRPKAVREVLEAAREKSARMIEILCDIAENSDDDRARKGAAEVVLAYGLGKPTQTVAFDQGAPAEMRITFASDFTPKDPM